MSYSERGMF